MKKVEGRAFRSILPLILAVLAFVLGLLAIRPSGISASQLPASGIALYDRLATQIDRDLQANSYNLLVPDDYVLSSGMRIGDGLAGINQQGIAALAGHFSEDPRYWQLCWLTRAHGGEAAYLAQDRYTCVMLSDAWQRGIRDEGMCYLLMMQSEEVEGGSFVDSGRALWADNSFWHYAAAEQALETADLAEFRLAMEAGNAAVRNQRPLPWPLSELAGNPRLPKDADSLAVQGVLAQIARSQREGAMRSPTDPTELIPAAELDATTVRSYLEMQVRLAEMQGNGLVQLWRPSVSISRLLAEQGLGSGWGAADRLWLEEVRGRYRLVDAGELPAMYGMQLEGDGELEFGKSDEPQAAYVRNQQSWIITLNSWKLDQQRAVEKAAQLRAILQLD